jgi:hypothetical protein
MAASQSSRESAEQSQAKRTKTVGKIPLVWNESIFGLKENFSSENVDVVFVDEESDSKFPSHKMILSVVSPIFFKMFQGEWKEKNQERLPVPGGFQWSVFETVMCFLYGEQVEIEEDLLPELFAAANFLQLNCLTKTISSMINDSKVLISDPLVVIKLCEIASAVADESGVYLSTITYLAKSIETVLEESIDYSSLPFCAIEDISKSEDVSVPEIALFQFLCNWSQAKEDKLSFKSVQDLFSNVRYGTLSRQQLRLKVSESKFYNCEMFGNMLNASLCLEFEDGMLPTGSALLQFLPRRAQKPKVLFHSWRKSASSRVSGVTEGLFLFHGLRHVVFSVRWESDIYCTRNSKWGLHLYIHSCSDRDEMRSILIPLPPLTSVNSSCFVTLTSTMVKFKIPTITLNQAALFGNSNMQCATKLVVPVDIPCPWVVRVISEQQAVVLECVPTN